MQDGLDNEGSRWTPLGDYVLRTWYREPGGLAYLVGVLHRTRAAIKSRSKKIGAGCTGRYVTPEQDAVIRRDYATRPVAAIAAEIGKKVWTVYNRAHALGIRKTGLRYYTWTAAHDQVVRDRHALGWSDAEIAAEVGYDRRYVAEKRRRMGLPSNRFHQHGRQRVAAKTREQLAAAGVASLAELKRTVIQRRNVEAGWPADLSPREAAILEYLWTHGPSSRREIYAGIGFDRQVQANGPHWSPSCNRPVAGGQTSYLGDLIRRGLVVYYGRCVSTGRRGGNYGLYSLPIDIQRNLPPDGGTIQETPS